MSETGDGATTENRCRTEKLSKKTFMMDLRALASRVRILCACAELHGVIPAGGRAAVWKNSSGRTCRNHRLAALEFKVAEWTG